MSIPRRPDLGWHSTNWVCGLARVRVVPGCALGVKVPFVQLLLETSGNNMLPHLHEIQNGLYDLSAVFGIPLKGPKDAAKIQDLGMDPLVRSWLTLLSMSLAQVSGVLSVHVNGPPLAQHREDLRIKKDSAVNGYIVLWPCHWAAQLMPLLIWSLTKWMAFQYRSEIHQRQMEIQAARSEWVKLSRRLQLALPAGVNPVWLLSATLHHSVPVICWEPDLIQFGHGCRSLWIRSTMTERTSALGVSLARDKVRTSRLLRQAGVPTPRHLEVADAQTAVQAAGQLGWPVVVKPADQDRGDGARANLHTPEQVTAAFEHAAQISRRVLVEQHVDGHEYRLTVVNGQLFWAHERVPASVIGDGQHTLQQLIDAENARRQQALLTDPYGWVPIQMDVDNLSYLQDNGRTLQDIPAQGEVVRLQRVPAATTGGGGRAYFDTIHPDNRLLAERAAQLLRLDIAGVDLIMPDITRSWREVGGAVTEVNAIPQISIQTDPTLAQRLLQHIMPHSGRIPVLFVLAATTPAWVADIASRLNEAGLRVGLTTDEGLHIGQDWIRGPRASVWDDIRALQIDPSVGAIVVVSSGEALLQTGLPFDAVDALVVEAYQPDVLSLMLPYVRGLRAVVGDGLRQQYGKWMQAGGQSWQTWASAPEAVHEQITAASATLLIAEAAYAQGPAAVGAMVDPLLPKTIDGT